MDHIWPNSGSHLEYKISLRASCWSKARDNLKASPQVDIWAFGALAFKTAVKDGASIFHSTEADNIVKREDLQTLAYGWEQRKLAEMKRVVWADAADLVLKCLQTALRHREGVVREIDLASSLVCLKHREVDNPGKAEDRVVDQPLFLADAHPRTARNRG